MFLAVMLPLLTGCFTEQRHNEFVCERFGGDRDNDGVCTRFDCNDFNPDIYPGAPCDDGDDQTVNDVYTDTCTCFGI